MSYVNVALAAVPTQNKQAYTDSATKMGEVFCSLGALRVIETWENEVPDGKISSIPMAVKREAGESIVLSIIFWPSKQIADEAMASMMESDAMKEHMPMDLFDFSRLIHGGFDTIVDMAE